jgi:hypothetical protein
VNSAGRKPNDRLNVLLTNMRLPHSRRFVPRRSTGVALDGQHNILVADRGGDLYKFSPMGIDEAPQTCLGLLSMLMDVVCECVRECECVSVCVCVCIRYPLPDAELPLHGCYVIRYPYFALHAHRFLTRTTKW